MDARTILLLSGAIASGKSTLATVLVSEHGYLTIRSGAYLRDLATREGLDSSRNSLQTLGDRRDAETDYSWLIDEVAVPVIEGQHSQRRWLLDAVRKTRQVEHFRARFARQVFHAHLSAPETVLRRRYDERLARGDEYLGATPYDVAVQHPNEREARSLSSVADLVLDTSQGESVSILLDAINGRA